MVRSSFFRGIIVWALMAASFSSAENNNNNNEKCRASSKIAASDHPDRVFSLPGFDQPLPSPWYSGYLNYTLEGRQVHTHYVLIEAEENDDDDDDNDQNAKPLIYWSNGGPGASSLFGLLTELGPLILSDLSIRTEAFLTTGIPTPMYNPYTWSRLGSILIIDQPAPVGFSYCNNDDQANTHSCGGLAWTDELASQNSYLALQEFYHTHPCASSVPLFLTGESYGGIYVPTLARRIIEGKQRASSDSNLSIPLKGFAVGDGCLGTKTSVCGSLGSAEIPDYWHYLFLAGHHQIPMHDFRQLLKACHHADQPGFLTTTTSPDDKACKAVLAKLNEEKGGYFEYSLYDDCTYRNGLLRGKSSEATVDVDVVQGALNDYPCGGGPVMEEYLKMTQVKQALHVVSDFFEVDNAEGDFDYTPTEPDLTGFYKDLVQGGGDNNDDDKYRILIYNGDTDPAITSFAAQNWTSSLGFNQVQRWRPWTIDGCQRMGGYVVRYEGKFDFLTIRGAGHMVPTYKPEATFAFLKAWILDEDYPAFDANCTHPEPVTAGVVLPAVSPNDNAVGSSTPSLRG